MMTERDELAGVPVLLARPTSTGSVPPIALWFHGFRADAAANAAELVGFAAAGFLAVGIDAVGHGARRDDDIVARIAATPGGARAVMLAQAAQTIAEVPGVIATLAARGLGDATRVGLVGVSMGGYLVYRAALEVAGVRAAVAVLGSPKWPDDASPHRRPGAFRGVALLSITAERDVNVPPHAARRLHAAIAADSRSSHRAEYIELPGAEHLVSGAEWSAAMAAAQRWLVAHV